MAMSTSQFRPREDLQFVQIALNTSDPAGTLRLYCEAFGSVAGGGNAFWGDATRSQGLGNDARGTVWWLVGRQPFLQFEIFQHTSPPQQPLPPDYRASDIGWTRFGISVADFDHALTALTRRGCHTITEPVVVDGLRRVVFRDPFVGCFVEIFEDGPARPGGDEQTSGDPRPAIVYAACSVPDLAAAKAFYTDMIGLEAIDRAALHAPEHEALWGLDGAECDGFLLRLGDVFIEVVEYRTPAARPRPAHHRIVDQGIMNVALGSRNIPLMQSLISELRDHELAMTPAFSSDIAAASYVIEPGREVELIGLAEEADSIFGFTAGTPFFS